VTGPTGSKLRICVRCMKAASPTVSELTIADIDALPDPGSTGDIESPPRPSEIAASNLLVSTIDSVSSSLASLLNGAIATIEGAAAAAVPTVNLSTNTTSTEGAGSSAADAAAAAAASSSWAAARAPALDHDEGRPRTIATSTARLTAASGAETSKSPPARTTRASTTNLMANTTTTTTTTTRSLSHPASVNSEAPRTRRSTTTADELARAAASSQDATFKHRRLSSHADAPSAASSTTNTEIMPSTPEWRQLVYRIANNDPSLTKVLVSKSGVCCIGFMQAH